MAELREKYAHVLAEIDRLNEDWKRALTLRLLEDRPYAEVAELLGASLDKVKQDVCRARKQLRARLAKKGIILPAALAGVLLGGSARGRAPAAAMALMTAAIVIGAVVVALRTPAEPEPLTDSPGPSTPQAESVPEPPRADEVVLARVVAILDRTTGMKTRRAQVLEDGPRRVRWRFMFDRDPDRDPGQPIRFGTLLTEKSYFDLIFDRWSGKLDMELALDGKKAKNIDPLRPIIIGPPSFEVVIRIPELVEIHQVFPMMLMKTVPPSERNGPLRAEPVQFAIVASATDIDFARPEPDQGVVIRLEPGAMLSATRRPGRAGRQTLIQFWRTGESSEIHSLAHGQWEWSYRNESAETQEIFIAAVCGKSDGPKTSRPGSNEADIVPPFGKADRWMTCQSRVTIREDGTQVLDFDEDYEGRFGDVRVEVRSRPAR